MKQIVLDAPDQVGTWVCERLDSKWFPGRGTAIGLLGPQGWLAGVVYEGWNGASLLMHVAAIPGCRWMTRDYLRICFLYPFGQLAAKKVIGLVGSNNLDAQRFDEHLGFVREATLEGAHPDGALLVYTMTPEQCRWIRLKEEPHGEALSTAAA